MMISPILSLLSVNTLLVLIIAAFVLYKYSTRNNDYWKKKGFPYAEPTPIFGNFFDVLRFRLTIGDLLAKFYKQFDDSPYFGMFVLDKPHLVVKDPNIIKCILIKDFNYFYDRTMLSDEKCDPISSNMLFLLKNPEWKYMRTKMTPVFTTGKIKNMFVLIDAACQSLKTYIDDNLHQRSIETKEVCSKYATDVITSCAFGLEAGSFKHKDSQFRDVGRKMFDFRWTTAFRQTSYFLLPSFARLFRLPFLDPSATSFLRNVFWKTIEERKTGDYKRNDVIDIIKELSQQSGDFKLEGDEVVAQAAQFFAAGFETVGATMSFTMYELCMQPKIQQTLKEEIKATISQYKQLSYEAVQSMKYLHMVVCETLRKYPVLPFLDRMCMSDYKLPNSDLIIEKGTPVYIPMFGLHYDPKYFPNPDAYNPERFSDENKSKLPSFSYIPFGDGPRNCIGERFGLIATKTGLAQILSEFDIETSVDTPIPIKFETKTFLLASEVGLPLKFKKSIPLSG